MVLSSETLVTHFKESGLTQETFCKNNNIPIERLRYYLYKKSRSKIKTGKRRINPKRTQTFVSFPQPSEPLLTKNSASNYTIVHGAFTHQQLAMLIRELGDSAC
jgi:hypothetical protein